MSEVQTLQYVTPEQNAGNEVAAWPHRFLVLLSIGLCLYGTYLVTTAGFAISSFIPASGGCGTHKIQPPLDFRFGCYCIVAGVALSLSTVRLSFLRRVKRIAAISSCTCIISIYVICILHHFFYS